MTKASRPKDSQRIGELSKAIHRRQEESKSACLELQAALGEYVLRKADFDKQLADLDDRSGK